MVDQAYRTAFAFLDLFWARYKADFDQDLPTLLSSMAVDSSDNRPNDLAYEEAWAAASVGTSGLMALVRMLEQYRELGEMPNQDISRLLTWIRDFPHNANALWQEAQAVVGLPSL
jgi:hypothetical protein